MSGARYVVLGLAPPRAAWFAEVGRWAGSGTIPVDFVRCVSVDEVRARLVSGRSASALLVDTARTGLDRDLLDLARGAGVAVLVVGDDRRDWVALGAAAQLRAPFSRVELVDALEAHAGAVRDLDPAVEARRPAVDGGWRAALVAVTGAGGAGSSTVAMGIAQALAADPRNLGLVLLADLVRDGELGMLHDAQEVVPGVQELVEAFRTGALEPDEVRALTFAVVDRGYHLLLGLRRHRDWTAIRPRAFDAALDGVRRTFHAVVADVDADVEGEDATGSIDVEERNVFARVSLRRADLVAVVGLPGTKGMHALVRTVHRLVEHGVDPTRLLPVFNRVGRSPSTRAELSRTFARFTELDGAAQVPNPLFLPERHLEHHVNRASALPSTFVRPIGAAVVARLEARHDRPETSRTDEPVAIAPGSLGHWADLHDDGIAG